MLCFAFVEYRHVQMSKNEDRGKVVWEASAAWALLTNVDHHVLMLIIVGTSRQSSTRLSCMPRFLHVIWRSLIMFFHSSMTLICWLSIPTLYFGARSLLASCSTGDLAMGNANPSWQTRFSACCWLAGNGTISRKSPRDHRSPS